jgi:hypothetical protein
MLSSLDPVSQLAWLLVLVVLAFFVAAEIYVEIRLLPGHFQLLKLRFQLLKLALRWQLMLRRFTRELGVSRAEARTLFDHPEASERLARFGAVLDKLIDEQPAEVAQITRTSD